ncbi:VapE domain-containing protein [Salipiger abyssi]|uniref:Primase C terminal 2 (PriCT-2) n=1 Tax=Salipiger abyssi TaxID=1250539 RepID=A0A1P8UXM1_9RHOB|nr:VapE domain-containing protein [Salipiger abyssi]APZ54096.1 Primase C terminal 2 (PriCT-2) [Salipiger abyssi]
MSHSNNDAAEMQANLDVALAWAEVGIPIFPARAESKRPHVTGWQDKATTDPAQLRRWWRKWPDAMPAIPTGSRSGIAVLDLDRKNGKDGFETLRELGHDPDVLSPHVISTPSGGGHIYFRHVDGLRNSTDEIGPGVDVRAYGGLVIAPGAINGKGSYGRLSGPLKRIVADLPEWPAVLQSPARKPRQSSGDVTGLSFEDFRDALMTVPNDDTNPDAAGRDWWVKMLAGVHHETDGSEEGLELAQEWSAQHDSYDPDQTEAVWQSFLRNDGATGATVLWEARKRGWGFNPADLLTDEDVEVARERGAVLDLLPDDDTPPPEGTLEYVEWMMEQPDDAPTPAKKDWGTPIMRGNNPVINLHNTTLYLGRNLDSVLPGLAHNRMTGRDEWRDGPLTDAAVSLARIALERLGLQTVGKDLVADAAQTVARKLAYHPIRDQLRALRWDGKPRLDSWLVRHAGAENTPYTRAVGRKFLIAMVARVMEPGCKHDHTLVLSGEQGQNKSTACRVLAGAEYFSDTLPSITGDRTDAIRHLQGKWLVEFAELAPSRKSETEDLKAFLSGAVDRVRLPYARYDEAFHRQCVFVGTTNEEQFLRDATGGRRFWPVRVCKVIDIEALTAERDQLFAEAFAAYSDDEPWWLDRDFEAEHAKPVQEAARESDSWAEDVAAWLDLPQYDQDEEGTVRTEVTISEVLSGPLELTSAQQHQGHQKRAAAIMRDLGWVKRKTRSKNVWCRGDFQ